MFDLARWELRILLFLLSALIVGFGVKAYRDSREAVIIDVRNVRSEKDPRPALEGVPLKEKININVAGLEDLMRLRGVGRVLAQRIIEYRSSKGFFNSVDGIRKVKGIGEKRFEEIKDEITTE